MNTIKNLLSIIALVGIAALSIDQLFAQRIEGQRGNFSVSESSANTAFNSGTPPAYRPNNNINPRAQSQSAARQNNNFTGDCGSGVVSDYVDKHLVRLEKSAPAAVSMNQPFDYNYRVVAKDKIRHVVVWEQIPEGAVYVDSSPQARIEGRDVIWTLYDLEKGDQIPLTLTVRAVNATDLSSCATITAYPEACTITRVGMPELAIVKSTPNGQVLLGSSVPWDITVTNVGNYCAYDVMVTDTLPRGVTHQSGNNEFISEIGTLAPGESRDIRINTTANDIGEHCNVAMASASNAPSVSADACVRVLEAGLVVTKEGTPAQFIGKQAFYRIAVANTGQIPLDDVVVTDSVPQQNRLLSAPGAQISGNRATWMTQLNPGETKLFELSVVGLQEGTYCNEVGASSAAFGLRSQDNACTDWRGFPALLIEVIDTEDPLLVGEQTTYVIQITNQGTASDTNVFLEASLPNNLRVVSTSGATRGIVNGNTIRFAPYANLKAKEIIQFQVTAQATSEGDARFRARVSSDLLRTPVPEEEATQVY